MPENTVTKRDLAKAVAKNGNVTQMEASEIIQSFLDQVIEELADGNRLELRDFGVLEPRLQKGRKARNPRTGEEVYAEPKATVRFKVGKKMREDVQKCMSKLK